MSFLVTRTDEQYRLVWTDDPAVRKTDPEASGEWIAEERAELHAGASPDVIVARPLSASELLRISGLVEQHPEIICEAAALAVVEIVSDGSSITDPERIRSILSHAGNVESIGALAQAVIAVSREGCDSLPFRHGRSEELPADHGEPVGSGLLELSARAKV